MARARIHFAGINTTPLASATEGRDILVSYADVIRQPGWWERELKPRLEAGRYRSVILDSGAFTVISQGIVIDVESYAAFAAEHQDLFDVVVGLDDIAGDLGTTWRNQATLEAAGVEALPVFHQDEPWEVLEAYAERYDYIGVGFARREGGRLAHGQKENAAFLREFFSRVGDRAKVHGFAMTRWAGKGWPFFSVDSTTWIAEFRALRKQEPCDAKIDEPKPRFSGGDHGVSGDLANLLDWYDTAELMELVVDSYDPPPVTGKVTLSDGKTYEVDEDDVAEFEAWIEGDGLGQARTVFRRHGAVGLWQKINTIDARKCAAARPPLKRNEEADLVVLNLGVGRQSAALALMAIEGLIPKPDVAIFSDTGWERKQTHRYYEQILFPACERAGIRTFMVAADRHINGKGKFVGQMRRSGLGIRDDVLRSAREGTPVANARFWADKGDGESGPLKRLCTGEYKIEPITQKIREVLGLRPRQWATRFNVEQWIGIATEEEQRATGDSGLKWSTLRYPLLEMDLSTEDCCGIIEDLGYPVPVKSACVGCPYRSDSSWARIKYTDPDGWADAVDFDRRLRHPHGMGRLNDGLSEADYLAGCGADVRARIKGAIYPVYLHPSCKPLDEVDLPRDLMDDEAENFGGDFC